MNLTEVPDFFFYVLAAASVVLALMTVLTKRILRSAIYLIGVLAVSAGFYLGLGYEFLAGVQVLVYMGGVVVLIVFAIMLTGSLETEESPPSLTRRVAAFTVASAFFIITGVAFTLTSFSQTSTQYKPVTEQKEGEVKATVEKDVSATPAGDVLKEKESVTLTEDSLGALHIEAGVEEALKTKIDALPPQSDFPRSLGKALLSPDKGGYVIPFEAISLLLLAAAIGGIVIARRNTPRGQGFTSGEESEIEDHEARL